MVNLYQILGVRPTASADEIKASFKQMAMKYHPDLNEGSVFAEEKFKEINNAYQILTDPVRKAEYDRIFAFGEQQTGRHRDKYYQRKSQQYQNHHQSHTNTHYNYKRTEKKAAKAPMTHWEVTGWIAGGLVCTFIIFWSVKTALKLYDARIQYEEAVHNYYIKDNPSTALSLLAVAIERDPDYADPYLLYGKITLEQDENAKHAANMLSKGMLLVDSISAEHYLLRGQAYLKLGERRDAYADFKEVLKQDPHNLTTHYQLGELELYFQHRYPKAIEHFDVVLDDDPQHQQAHLHKGIALHKLKQFEASHISLSQALLLNPKDGVIYHYMGINSLQHTKDTVNACHLWYYAQDLGVTESNWFIRKHCDGIE